MAGQPRTWASKQIVSRRSDLIAPQVTGWPGGRRKLVCLRCPRVFWSSSKANRLCHLCHGVREGGDDRVRGKRNGSLIREL